MTITPARKKTLATIFFSERKLLVLHVFFLGKPFNQYHFLAITARKLSRNNTTAKRRSVNDSLLGHPDNSSGRSQANSGALGPKVNHESFSSGLFSKSLTI
jgi:hypothetical protein